MVIFPLNNLERTCCSLKRDKKYFFRKMIDFTENIRIKSVGSAPFSFRIFIAIAKHILIVRVLHIRRISKWNFRKFSVEKKIVKIHVKNVLYLSGELSMKHLGRGNFPICKRLMSNRCNSCKGSELWTWNVRRFSEFFTLSFYVVFKDYYSRRYK